MDLERLVRRVDAPRDEELEGATLEVRATPGAGDQVTGGARARELVTMDGVILEQA